MQRDQIDIAADPAAREQRGQRRGEADAGGVRRHVERLDPQPVTAEDEPPGVALVDGKGEHPDEVVNAPDTPTVIGLTDHLGVGGREETIALGGKLAAKFAVVVDTAVEDGREAELAVDHRLRTALRQINDLQAAMAERDRPGRPHAAGVRATRPHPVSHPRHRVHIGRGTVEPQFPAQTAHARSCRSFHRFRGGPTVARSSACRATGGPSPGPQIPGRSTAWLPPSAPGVSRR